MANTNLNDVVAGALASLGSSGADPFTPLEQQLRDLQAINLATAEVTRNNTTAVERNTSTQSEGSVAGTVGRTLESVFGIGTLISPLISGLTSLFGGGDDASAPASLVKFALPASVNASAGVSDSASGQVFAVDYGQGNISRPVASSSPQITVQVQAMDSKSFLDHSTDIALAVRQAMLESGVLNDVVREA